MSDIDRLEKILASVLVEQGNRGHKANLVGDAEAGEIRYPFGLK